MYVHVTVDTFNTNYQEKVRQFPHGLLDISISFYMELASEASALDLVAQGIRVIAFSRFKTLASWQCKI